VRCTMAMIVRVRGVEVVCETLDELDQIIDRYGEGAAPGAVPAHQVVTAPTNGASRSAAALDNGLLQAFVQNLPGSSRRWSRACSRCEGRIPGALRLWRYGSTSRRKPSKRRAREANAAGSSPRAVSRPRRH